MPTATLTSRRSTRVALGFCLAAIMTLTACESGWRVGDTWWVIDPKHPQTATKLDVTRVHGDTLNQKLAIDLTSGRASLTDTDGRVYPFQVEPGRVELLKQSIADRSWQLGTTKPPKDVADYVTYSLTVTDGETVVTPVTTWTDPTRLKKIPPTLPLVVDTFDRAHRVAHPLSDKVDLME